VSPCSLLVGVSLWFVLVGSGYLHALNPLSLLVRALPWKGIINSTYTNS